jgi:hypothetical protein
MQIDTLSEFLTQAGTEFRLYDLGRRLQPLSREDFAAIEAGQRPYPWPLQRHAWLAVCYWQRHDQPQPYVWFLKLPLDERGLFNNAAVKHFLAALVEQLGQDPSAPLSDEQQQRLSETPFTFQPAQDKLAAFHARLRLELGLPPSAFYQGVLDYLAAPEQHDWQQLGLQGLADLAARLHQDTPLSQQLASRLFSLPQPVQLALLNQCEHHSLPAALTEHLLDGISTELERQAPDQERIALLLRATAGCPPFAPRHQKIATLLALTPSQPLMLSLAARLWQELTDESLLLNYLEQLAEHHGELFNGLFAELVSIPALRPLILTNLHNPALSVPLKNAIGTLFSASPASSSPLASDND